MTIFLKLQILDAGIKYTYQISVNKSITMQISNHIFAFKIKTLAKCIVYLKNTSTRRFKTANSLQKLGKTDMCNFTFHTLILAEYTPLASTPDGVMSSFKACTYGSFWGAKVPNIPLLWSTEMPKNIYEIMNSQCNA